MVLLAAGAFAAWLLRCGTPARRPAVEVAPRAEPTAVAEPRVWKPRTTRAPAPGCRPQAARRCIDGDVWWIDGCDQAYDIADECGARPCERDACEADTPGGCGDVTELGRCRRDVAEVCQYGRLFEVDCAASRTRCVMTADGPGCRAPSSDDCRPDAEARCEGTTLRQCREGRWEAFDCTALGGACLPAVRGGTPARCVFAMPVHDGACGPCGCAPEPSEEVCDGRDNDLDGAIDEDAPCGVVPVVAFVIGGADGNYTDDDIATAIDETNAAFVRDDGLGLVFELRSIVRVDEPSWRELDADDLDVMLRTDRLLVASEDFYVPVVFTDVVIAAGVPRPGLSTVPNGMCGGARRIWDRQPPVGLVAVAKRRWPTTLAHEMGHFFGLCHTHEAPAPLEQVQSGAATLAEAAVCSEDCDAGPDGICDTPIDPGPESCGVDDGCAVHCATGDRPDPGNMMAYYPACRVSFSAQQALLMREVLALRRGWHRCVGPGCTCDPAASQCPRQMSCRPFAEADTAWRCDLDGPALPGGRCEHGGDCGGGAICVHVTDGADGPAAAGRCARTCDPEDATPACTCRAITTPQVAVCDEDLHPTW